MSKRDEPGDHYAILGIARTASLTEIRAAFRARAKQLHPDRSRSRDANEAFQRLQKAYSVLRRPELRREYDLLFEPSVEIERPAQPRAPVPAPPLQPWRKVAVGGLAMAVLALLSYWLFSPATDGLPASQSAATQLDREVDVAITRHAASFYGPPPESPEVEIAGRDGKKFVVPRVEYRRLEPIHDRLVSESRELYGRKMSLDARRAELEKLGRELESTNPAAITAHRIRVDAFNSEGAALRRHLELHAAEVENYFKEVERVAVASR